MKILKGDKARSVDVTLMLLLLMLQFAIATGAATFLHNNMEDYHYSQDVVDLYTPGYNAGLLSGDLLALYL